MLVRVAIIRLSTRGHVLISTGVSSNGARAALACGGWEDACAKEASLFPLLSLVTRIAGGAVWSLISLQHKRS